MFTPPAKVARTERHTVTTTRVTSVTNTSSSYTSAHFNAQRAGTSTKSFVSASTANSRKHGQVINMPISGVGKELAWIYAPGSKHISVYTVKDSCKISTAEIGGPVPVFKTTQGEVAFIDECDAKMGNPLPKTLVFCTAVGSVLSADKGIAFNFEYETSVSATVAPVMRPFDVRSFAVIPAQTQIAAPMFHKKIQPAEHIVAGTEDGFVLCASRSHDQHWNVLFCNVSLADAECAPSVAADLDVSGAGQYLTERQSAKVPRGQVGGRSAESQSNASSQQSTSWWKSWIPSGLRGGGANTKSPNSANAEGYDGLNDDLTFEREALYENENDENANLGNTGSSKVLAKLPNRRIEHVQAAKNGICFTVGGMAIALATKVASNPIRADERSDDTDGSLSQNGLRLVWSCPIVAILSPSRPATVAALTTSESTIYALILYDDQPASGILASISAHNGSVVSTRPVTLPDDAVTEGSAAPATRIELLASVASSNNSSQSVAVVVGNSISHLSLLVTAHNPCHSTDVESLTEEVLASGVIGGRLYVLTNDGPFPSDEAGEIDAARSRQQLASLLDTIRHEGGRVTADEAVLGASDSILHSAEAHADNWARQYASVNAGNQAGGYKEDLNALTYVTSQLHRRQLRHRSFVSTILSHSDLVAKLSPSTVARLISDQEKLLALRYLRELQNAEPRDGLHERTQSLLHQGVVSVATRNRSSSRLQSSRTSNAEIFYADHNSVVDLIEWSIAETCILLQSAQTSMANKVDTAIALGNLAPRILEAVYESRNTLTIPNSLLSSMWTSVCHNSPEGHHGIFELGKALAEVLSDALDVSVRFNVNLSQSHDVSATSGIHSNANISSPVTLEAQLSLLHLVDYLVLHTLTLHSSTAAGSQTGPQSGQSLVSTAALDFSKIITTSTFAEDLLTRTLLRAPFLVPAHVSPSTGAVHMYGYPYGVPKVNPSASKIGAAVLQAAENFAVKFKVYRILYILALSDPNAIGSFMGVVDMENQTPEQVSAAAAEFFTKYQEYCASVPTFFAASLHLFLMDSRFQREQEVCHSALISGLDRSCEPSATRNAFMELYAPQLLWFTSKAGPEASLALLREGVMQNTNIPAGDNALAHRTSCAALARLCWLSVATPEPELDDVPEDAKPQSATQAAASHIKNEVPNRIDLDLAIVGFQNRFLEGTHSNSVLAAPELVQQLLALPDNVDAWCAAAAVCDAIRNAHGGFFDAEAFLVSSSSPAAASSSSTAAPSPPQGANATVVQLLRQVYSTAMQHDGNDLLVKLQEGSTSETALTKAIAQTAQGRVALASHTLSGLPMPSFESLSGTNTSPRIANASPTSSALLGHRSAKTSPYQKNNTGVILGPLLGNTQQGQQLIKILSDWLDLYASKGGVLVAPSPTVSFLPHEDTVHEEVLTGTYPKPLPKTA